MPTLHALSENTKLGPFPCVPTMLLHASCPWRLPMAHMHPGLDAHNVYRTHRCEFGRAFKGTYVPHIEGSVALEGLNWILKMAPSRLSAVRFWAILGTPRLAPHVGRTSTHICMSTHVVYVLEHLHAGSCLHPWRSRHARSPRSFCAITPPKW